MSKAWMIGIVLVLAVSAMAIGSGVEVQIDNITIAVDYRADEGK